jgi:hypothetical protein
MLLYRPLNKLRHKTASHTGCSLTTGPQLRQNSIENIFGPKYVRFKFLSSLIKTEQADQITDVLIIYDYHRLNQTLQ